MNKFHWTYVDDYGKAHQVGLMHGARTGHVLVHCNTKIILIDFKVLQSKTYSLFIDEELCEISIERKDNQFLYGFEINKDVDTPLNRSRKAEEKKHIWQGVLFFGGILLSVAIIFAVMTNYKNNRDARLADELLAKNGEITFAKVFLEEEAIKYTYISKEKVLSFHTPSDEALKLINSNGFPLENGDEFELLYVPHNPKVHKINFEQPSDVQKGVYRQRAIDQELLLHSALDSTIAACRADIAFELKGIAGWADFYHQNTPKTANAKHNELTYKRLVRDLPFEKQAKKKCSFID